MSELKDEIAAYDRLRPELEASHLGKWALVHGQELQGTFEDFDAAAQFAVEKYGRGPYLIRQIGAPSVPLPASVMYRVYNADSPVRL